MSASSAAVSIVADTYDVNNVNPGTLGFVVVALLGAALWFLLRSMTRQLGKVDFDEDAASRALQSPVATDTPPKSPPSA